MSPSFCLVSDTSVVEMMLESLPVAMAASPGSPPTPPAPMLTQALPSSRYLVTNLMGADLNNIVKFQRLSDEHVQFLIYQLLRGLKVRRSQSRRSRRTCVYIDPTHSTSGHGNTTNTTVISGDKKRSEI